MNKSINFLAAAALILPGPVWAEVYAYVALPLTTSQETSVPKSNGYGSVTVLYETTTRTLMYSAFYKLSTGATATASHFHGSAALGANAPIEIPLPTQPTGNTGKLTGVVTLSAAQEAAMLSGNWYFNIHSTLAAGGELRAQLLENSATLQLPTFSDGTLTVPTFLAPGVTPASYSATLTYPGTGNTMTLTSVIPGVR